MDREAWVVAARGVAKSWPQLSDWTELNWTESFHVPITQSLLQKLLHILAPSLPLQHSLSYLRYRVPGLSLQFYPPNKTLLSTFMSCIFFRQHLSPQKFPQFLYYPTLLCSCFFGPRQPPILLFFRIIPRIYVNVTISDILFYVWLLSLSNYFKIHH